MLLFSHNQPEGLLKGIVLLPPTTSPNGLLLPTHGQPETSSKALCYCLPTTSPNEMLLFSHNQPEGLLKGIVLLPTHNQPERNVIVLPQPAWRPAQRHCGIYCPPSTSPNGLLLFTHNQPEGLLKERHCVIAIHDQPEQTVIAHPQPARTDLLPTHNQPEDQLKCTVLLPTYDQPKWTYCPPTTSTDGLLLPTHNQPEGLLKGIVLLPTHNQPEGQLKCTVLLPLMMTTKAILLSTHTQLEDIAYCPMTSLNVVVLFLISFCLSVLTLFNDLPCECYR